MRDAYSTIDKVAPYREIRVRNNQNPWMNSHILSLIRNRDGLLSRFKKDRSNTSAGKLASSKLDLADFQVRQLVKLSSSF